MSPSTRMVVPSTEQFHTEFVDPPEIPPIMAQSDILALQVLPGPVQPGELAEVGVFGGNVVPGVVSGESQWGLPRRANVERQVDGVGWGPIGFVDCN